MRPATKTLEHAGETRTISDWAAHTGLPYAVIYARLRLGWSSERILATPVQTPKTVQVNGQAETFLELSRRTGLHRTTLYARAQRGAPLTELMRPHPQPARGHTAIPHGPFQQWLFRFLVYYKTTHDGIAPSLRDIQTASRKTGQFDGISLSTIKYALVELRAAGHIDHIPNQPRSITINGGEWRYRGDTDG